MQSDLNPRKRRRERKKMRVVNSLLPSEKESHGLLECACFKAKTISFSFFFSARNRKPRISYLKTLLLLVALLDNRVVFVNITLPVRRWLTARRIGSSLSKKEPLTRLWCVDRSRRRIGIISPSSREEAVDSEEEEQCGCGTLIDFNES